MTTLYGRLTPGGERNTSNDLRAEPVGAILSAAGCGHSPEARCQVKFDEPEERDKVRFDSTASPGRWSSPVLIEALFGPDSQQLEHNFGRADRLTGSSAVHPANYGYPLCGRLRSRLPGARGSRLDGSGYGDFVMNHTSRGALLWAGLGGTR